MLKQLLTRLRGAIQLPECLRVVGYLRRMSALDEVGLRRTFLQCREGHVADAVADLDDTNAYEYLKRLTDLHRVHLFDVVMQYRAIFGDGLEDEDADSSQGVPTRVPTKTMTSTSTPTAGYCTAGARTGSALTSRWWRRRCRESTKAALWRR
jgi:hypothetical protein